MSGFATNCPRCGTAKVTFDLFAGHKYEDWETHYRSYIQSFEVFGRCRHCNRTTILILRFEGARIETREFIAFAQANPNSVTVAGFVSLKDQNRTPPPEHLPPAVSDVFREGATCLSVECFNAAGTMFRLCVDLATKEILGKVPTSGITDRERDNLSARLSWLFRNGHIPGDLEDLSKCVRQIGNDGAHEGWLTKNDAEDLCEFVNQLLYRVYTIPKNVELAQQRRDARRNPPKTSP